MRGMLWSKGLVMAELNGVKNRKEAGLKSRRLAWGLACLFWLHYHMGACNLRASQGGLAVEIHLSAMEGLVRHRKIPYLSMFPNLGSLSVPLRFLKPAVSLSLSLWLFASREGEAPKELRFFLVGLYLYF